MKRITFYLVAFFLVAFSWQGMAQYFTEDFENGGAFPSSWTLTNGTDDWAIDQGDDYGPGSAQSGDYAAFFNDYDYSSGTSAEMISPSFDLSGATSPVLTFWYVDNAGNDSVEVLVSTDGTNYTSLYTTDTSVPSWTQLSVDLSAYISSTVTVSFKGTSVWGASNPHVDNIVVEEAPTCPTPSGLTVTNITETTAEFDLTENGSATVWDFEVVMSGDAPTGTPTEDDITLPYTAWTGTQNTDYDVYYRSDCGQDNTTDVSHWVGPVSFSTVTTPPANDDCANAEVLTVNADDSCGSITAGTIAGATDSGVSDNGDGTPNDDVWYSFVATQDSHLIKLLNIAGTYVSLVHEVMSGDCTTLASVNLSPTSVVSVVSGLTVGDTYFVRVFGYASTAGRDTTFDVCIGSVPPPPTNNDFANAEMLNVGASCTNTLGTLISATSSGSTPIATCGSTDGTEADVWYSFVAPDDSNIVITTSVGTGANLDTVMELFSYDGTDLTAVACNDDNAAPFSGITIDDNSLVAGDTYYVQIHAYNGYTINDFNICATYAPPVNDNICDAIALTMDAASTGDAYTNFAATGETDEPEGNCFSGGIGGSVWFTFVAPASGAVNVTTNIPGGTNDDTEIAIYGAPTDCGDATTMGALLGCGQDIDANYLSEAFVASLVSGDTYYVQVDNWSSSFDGGTFGLEVHEVTVFNPILATSVISDCANSTDFSVDVDVTNLGGAATVTVTDGTTTNANVGLGVVSFGPYAAGTAVDFTVTNDDDATFTSTETVQYTCPPDNDLIGGAIPIIPSVEGTACDVAAATFTARLQGDGATDSGLDGSCYGNNTGIDLFYTWTATSDGLLFSGGEGEPGIIIRDAATGDEIDCEQTYVTDVALGGWAIGDNLIIQVYDYAGSDSNVTFCLSELTLPSLPDCPTLVSPADGATDVLSPFILDWDAATTGDPADSYNLYVSIDGGAEFLFSNYTDTQTPSIGLQPDLTVVWRIVPVNTAGENTACTTTFTFYSVVGTDDYDGDGVNNLDEYNGNTDMTAPCDPVQAAGYTGYDAANAIWMAADCDGDGETNDYEASNGSDPYDANSTTSVEELATVGFEYYPNPVNSNLTVKANENITSIAIFNMLGQQVKQVNPSSLNAQIDMTNLANGTYFIKATVGEKVGTFKIVKK